PCLGCNSNHSSLPGRVAAPARDAAKARFANDSRRARASPAPFRIIAPAWVANGGTSAAKMPQRASSNEDCATGREAQISASLTAYVTAARHATAATVRYLQPGRLFLPPRRTIRALRIDHRQSLTRVSNPL